MDSQQRVKVIAEALPFIRRYRGKRVLVKIGGSALSDDGLLGAFAKDVSLLAMAGIGIVVVHGGGPQIKTSLEKAGIPERKKNGIRITDEKTLGVVEKVLGEIVNGKVVAAIKKAGVDAVGMSGNDKHLIQARRKTGEGVDYGLVGQVASVNTASINEVRQGTVPVVAPLGRDQDGSPLNVNADEVASALVVALGGEALLMLTDTDGVHGEDGKTITDLSAAALFDLVERGVIEGGMLPKARCALAAVEGGVPSSRIMNGKTPHTLLLELLTDEGAGTMVHAKLPSSGAR